LPNNTSLDITKLLCHAFLTLLSVVTRLVAMPKRTTIANAGALFQRSPNPSSPSASLRTQLVRDGLASLALRVSAACLALLLSTILARGLGPEGYGTYSFILSLVLVAVVPAQLGLPELLVRETARATLAADWPLLRGIWRWATVAIIASSLLTILLGLAFAITFGAESHLLSPTTLLWGLILIPLISLTRLCGGMLQGLRRIVAGQVPDGIALPAFLLAIVSILLILDSSTRLSPPIVLALHTASAALALAMAAWLARRFRPPQITHNTVPVYRARHWLASALPLAFVAGMAVVNTQTDTIMLGILMTPEDVGLYRVAAQGSALVSLGLGAIAMLAMPYYAQFHAAREIGQLQHFATAVARATLALAIPVALVFVVLGKPILRSLFGADYLPAYPALVILSLSHVIHAYFGLLGPLLNMAGHERVTAAGIAFASVCNVAFNLIAIPLYGVTGAAGATAATLVIWNLVLWTAIRRRLGVDTSAFIFRPTALPKISGSHDTDHS